MSRASWPYALNYAVADEPDVSIVSFERALMLSRFRQHERVT